MSKGGDCFLWAPGWGACPRLHRLHLHNNRRCRHNLGSKGNITCLKTELRHGVRLREEDFRNQVSLQSLRPTNPDPGKDDWSEVSCCVFLSALTAIFQLSALRALCLWEEILQEVKASLTFSQTELELRTSPASTREDLVLHRPDCVQGPSLLLWPGR